MNGIDFPWPDLPPRIIELLWIIRERATVSRERLEWADDSIDAILSNWRHAEDLEQLRRDLGLDLTKKRRRVRTFQSEYKIVVAIVDEALAGSRNPIRSAGEKLKKETRQVQRARETWGPYIVWQLELMESRARSPDERLRIRSAIDRLKSPHLKLNPRRAKPRDKK